MMKKFLSLAMVLCLLLAACPAALAGYNTPVSGSNRIRTTVVGGMLTVHVNVPAYDNDGNTLGGNILERAIPLGDSLMSARIELPYGTQTYSFLWTSAREVNFAFNEQDVHAYGLDKWPDAMEILQNNVKAKDAFTYTRNLAANTNWQQETYYTGEEQELFVSDYETTFALQVRGPFFDGTPGTAKFFLPSARAAGISTVLDIEPAFFRYFLTNGPAITGTEYDAATGKLYDLLMKEGTEADWTLTFKDVEPDELTKVSLGNDELVKDEDYTVEDSGSDTKVTLKGSFLKKLKSSYHKVQFDFMPAGANNACKTAALINVVTERPVAPAAPSVPTTGDNTQLVLWSVMLCLSAGVAAWLFSRRKYAR